MATTISEQKLSPPAAIERSRPVLLVLAMILLSLAAVAVVAAIVYTAWSGFAHPGG